MRFATVFSAFVIAGSLVSTMAQAASASPTAASLSPPTRTRIVELPPIRISGIHSAMQGPQLAEPFELDPDRPGERWWIVSLRVDVLDAFGEIESPEFLCHSDVAWSSQETGAQDLTVSQGMKEMALPEGFGIVVGPADHLAFGAMAENNSYEGLEKVLRFRATIEYLSDEEARKGNLQALQTVNLIAFTRFFEPPVHEPHALESPEVEHIGSMWMVPPGRQVYRAAMPNAIQYDGTVHFIKLHLHPYGEFVELFDNTTGQVVWHGSAKNHAERRSLVETDYYSDPQGFPVFGDHDYSLVIGYNNTTDHDVDAMGALRLYVRPDPHYQDPATPISVSSSGLDRCQAFVATGDRDAAVQACLEAARTAPADLATRRRIGFQLMRLGREEEATQLLLEGTGASPDARALILKGLLQARELVTSEAAEAPP